MVHRLGPRSERHFGASAAYVGRKSADQDGPPLWRMYLRIRVVAPVAIIALAATGRPIFVLSDVAALWLLWGLPGWSSLRIIAVIVGFGIGKLAHPDKYVEYFDRVQVSSRYYLLTFAVVEIIYLLFRHFSSGGQGNSAASTESSFPEP